MMSQVLFAGFLGVDASTIRAREQGSRSPRALVRRFMAEIESGLEFWTRRIAQTLAAKSLDGSPKP